MSYKATPEECERARKAGIGGTQAEILRLQGVASSRLDRIHELENDNGQLRSRNRALVSAINDMRAPSMRALLLADKEMI